ncbi:hypothetical protein B0H19DRAFT_1267716 [Mycena capillaripes]|nr:hypothetical protein B0H19DRAFT_1267716 [Mycena capillaripes]
MLYKFNALSKRKLNAPAEGKEEDINSILIECVLVWTQFLGLTAGISQSWTPDLTWILITAIESDEEIRDSLSPALLAEMCSEEHEKYGDALAKISTPAERTAWCTKIKNRITVADEITVGTALTTKWDLIKTDSPWFFNVRDLIAARPNLQPVGLGNNDSDFDTSLLLPTTDGDTSSVQDDTLDKAIDVGSDSKNSEEFPLTVKPVKRKRADTPVDEKKPITKKTKPHTRQNMNIHHG